MNMTLKWKFFLYPSVIIIINCVQTENWIYYYYYKDYKVGNRQNDFEVNYRKNLWSQLCADLVSSSNFSIAIQFFLK